MSISVLDLFKIGVGPSSSHTVGPMRAAYDFVVELQRRGLLDQVRRIEAKLYGSLSATGVGHGTDRAVVAGLMGARPDEVDPDFLVGAVDEVRIDARLPLAGTTAVPFDTVRSSCFPSDCDSFTSLCSTATVASPETMFTFSVPASATAARRAYMVPWAKLMLMAPEVSARRIMLFSSSSMVVPSFRRTTAWDRSAVRMESLT